MRYYYLTSTPDIKKFKRGSAYPSGEKIPESLPDSYQIHQDCASCAAFDEKTSVCAAYNAPVLSNYWCSSWKARA